MAVGSINFQRQLGKSQFDVDVEGDTALSFVVEVFPTKLDYEDDYEQLLSDVTQTARVLAFEYLRATYRDAAAGVDDAVELDFAILLRQRIDELDRALRYIASHPHRRLVREFSNVRIDRIRRPSRLTTTAIRRGRGSGPWAHLPGVGKAHTQLPAVSARDTLDTPEHRWLRNALEAVMRDLNRLAEGLQGEIARAKKREWSTTRLNAELGEITGSSQRIARMLRSEPLAEAPGPPPAGFTSLTLLGQSGYREAYRALIGLRLGLHLSGDPFEVSIKDLDDLYEMWCFLRVVVLVRDLHGLGGVDAASLFNVRAAGLRVRLVEGQTVELQANGRVVRIAYNKSFSGLTGSQRPDILIEVERVGWPKMFLLLDAKYRIDASSRYVKQFLRPGPPIDAINQLHRYRDALLIDAADIGAGRPTVRGAALFPATESSAAFTDAPLFEALSSLGIGALPFLPSDQALVASWLRETLELPTGELSHPGPPFLAAQEASTRRVLARETVLLVARSAEVASDLLGRDEVVEATTRTTGQGFQYIGLIVQDVAGGKSRLCGIAPVVDRQLAGGPPPTLRFKVGTWMATAGREWDSGPITYPLLCSRLALQLAETQAELGLKSYDEWELYESAQAKAPTRVGLVAPIDPAGLRAEMLIDTAAGTTRVIANRAGGFHVELPDGNTAEGLALAETIRRLD